MKKIIVSGFLSVYLIFSSNVSYAAESDDYAANSEVGFLVEMLVANGTVTREQASQLARKAKILEEETAKARQREMERMMQALILQQRQMINGSAQNESGDMFIDLEREQEVPMNVKWNDGVRIESRNGDFETKIGGRIFVDAVNTSSHGELPDSIRPAGDFNNRNDQASLRSARLNIEGKMYDDYFYNFEYEFDGDINTKTEVDGLRDMYFGMKDIPFLGSVSVGHMKEPFGLEEVTSSSDNTFLERSLANVFAPGFSWGVKNHNAILDDRVTYSAGMFFNSDNSGTTSYGDAWNITTRVTGLPWYGGKDKLVHLGTSYTLRNPKEGGFSGSPDNTVRFRQRPEMNTIDYIVDTGNLYIDQENRLGVEAAFLYGPFSVQGEFIQTWLDPYDSSLETGRLYGGYGSVSYILTGEHRVYDKNDGRFQGVIPNNNFSFKDFSLKNIGAWEIAARWSYVSLEDDDMAIDGGKASALTVGINWYLNPNMRLMLNWVHSEREDMDGAIDGIQLRAQVDF